MQAELQAYLSTPVLEKSAAVVASVQYQCHIPYTVARGSPRHVYPGHQRTRYRVNACLAQPASSLMTYVVVGLSECACASCVAIPASRASPVFRAGWECERNATCIIGAIRNSDDIAISSWTLSRYRDQKKSPRFEPYFQPMWS